MKKILLLSDTHGLIDEKIINYANSADEIWHAGDIGDINVINKLQKYGLVRGVYGNIDNILIRSLFSDISSLIHFDFLSLLSLVFGNEPMIFM